MKFTERELIQEIVMIRYLVDGPQKSLSSFKEVGIEDLGGDKLDALDSSLHEFRALNSYVSFLIKLVIVARTKSQ